jgi:SepF-like predicted cell division protein (DUF552 family)
MGTFNTRFRVVVVGTGVDDTPFLYGGTHMNEAAAIESAKMAAKEFGGKFAYVMEDRVRVTCSEFEIARAG